MERMNLFATNKFQVDVLWFDIDYAEDKQYFQFNHKKFEESKHNELNELAKV